jgi:hypothetical protein
MRNIFFSWTFPDDAWLFGIEFAPDNIITDLDSGEETYYSVLSIGLLIFRIEILMNKNEENGD